MSDTLYFNLYHGGREFDIAAILGGADLDSDGQDLADLVNMIDKPTITGSSELDGNTLSIDQTLPNMLAANEGTPVISLPQASELTQALVQVIERVKPIVVKVDKPSANHKTSSKASKKHKKEKHKKHAHKKGKKVKGRGEDADADVDVDADNDGSLAKTSEDSSSSDDSSDESASESGSSDEEDIIQSKLVQKIEVQQHSDDQSGDTKSKIKPLESNHEDNVADVPVNIADTAPVDGGDDAGEDGDDSSSKDDGPTSSMVIAIQNPDRERITVAQGLGNINDIADGIDRDDTEDDILQEADKVVGSGSKYVIKGAGETGPDIMLTSGIVTGIITGGGNGEGDNELFEDWEPVDAVQGGKEKSDDDNEDDKDKDKDADGKDEKTEPEKEEEPMEADPDIDDANMDSKSEAAFKRSDAITSPLVVATESHDRKVKFKRVSDVICNDYVSGLKGEIGQLGLDGV